jgi:hypothetical protein
MIAERRPRCGNLQRPLEYSSIARGVVRQYDRSVTLPRDQRSDLSSFYIIGRLMASPHDLVRAELDDAIMAALFRGMWVPDWITEGIDGAAIMTPEWVNRQLDEVAPQLLHQPSEDPPK